MSTTKVDVLGTEYSVTLDKRKKLTRLSKDNMGECRVYSKELNCLRSKENGCNEEEKEKRAEEIVAHEMFHAFVNESGLCVSDDVEEVFAYWYMKVWRKMNNAILQVLDENGLLD